MKQSKTVCTPDHDLHIHTYLSSCCTDKARHTPHAILQHAKGMGLNTIGFADHVWVNPDIAPGSWYQPQGAGQIEKLRRDLAAEALPLRVLVGCESDMEEPGRFGMTRAFAESLDFVLLACNHFFSRFDAHPSQLTPRTMADQLLLFFRSAVQSGLADMIPHPFLPCGYLDYFAPAVAAISDQEFLDAFGLAAECGVAMEITASFLSRSQGGFPDRPEWSVDTPLRMLRLARDAGCRFSLGSDAHELGDLDRLPRLQCFLKELALTPDQLWRCRGEGMAGRV